MIRLFIILFSLLMVDSAAAQQLAALSPQQRAPSALSKAMKLILSLATPSISETTRNLIVRDYEAAQGHKAQAIEPQTKRFWRSVWRETPARAVEAALEGCQFRYQNPCAIIAVDDEVAEDSKLMPKSMPRLAYKGKFDLAMIPAVREATLNRGEIRLYEKSSGQKAMSFHSTGRLFVSVGKKDVHEAVREALASCNTNKTINTTKDGPCFVYAINNDVVLTERLTK